MSHYDDDQLAQYAFDRSIDSAAAIEAHVGACAECAERLRFIERIDAELSDPASWQACDEVLQAEGDVSAEG